MLFAISSLGDYDPGSSPPIIMPNDDPTAQIVHALVSSIINGLVGAATTNLQQRAEVGARQPTQEVCNMPMGCIHNDKGPTTINEVIAHVMNGEYGSAAQDIAEDPRVHDAIRSAGDVALDTLNALGNEMMKTDEHD